MSLLKKLAGETAIYGVSSILGRLLNYVVMTFFLTRIFEKSAYGVVSDMYATSAILLVLFTYRLETAFFRFGKDKKSLGPVFATSSILLFGTTLFFVFLLLVFSDPIAVLLEHPGKGHYFRMFAIIIGADALSSIPFARLRLINRPVVFASIKIASIFINIMFILFFLALCPYLIEKGWPLEWLYNEEDRIAYVFLANMIASVVMLLLLVPSYFRLKWTFDPALVKKMLLYTWPLIIVSLAGIINQNIGYTFLKYKASPDPEQNRALMGVFGAAIKIPVLMTLFTQAFNYAAEPFFFRNAERDDSRAIYGQVGQAFTLVAVLVFLGISFYIDLIKLIIGKDLRDGIGIVPIFLLAYLFLGLFYNFSIWYKLADRTRMGSLIALGGLAITLLVNAILVPRIGIYGPAWAALACYIFMALAAYFSGQRHYRIDYPIRKMAAYLLIGLSAFFINDWFRTLWPDQPILIMGLNSILLILCLAGIYKIDPNMINGVLRSFRKKKS